MKRTCLLFLLALITAPASFAQGNEHVVEFGGFFDYTRLDTGDQNFFGLGGRFAVNPHPNLGIEAEGSYFFRRQVGELTDFNTTNVNARIVPALLGLKLQSNGPVRFYGTVKGGIVNLNVSPEAGFVDVLRTFDDSTTRGALYPAVGIEFGGGWLGLRTEVGDLIYWLNGSHHNLRVNIGPQFRF